jgi:hypothetical protein
MEIRVGNVQSLADRRQSLESHNHGPVLFFLDCRKFY